MLTKVAPPSYQVDLGPIQTQDPERRSKAFCQGGKYFQRPSFWISILTPHQTSSKLVESDYNKGRVQDPTKIEKKHEDRVKKYCKDFFDKAAAKHKEREKHRAEKKHRQQHQQQQKHQNNTASPSVNATPADDADPVTTTATAISPDDDPASLKRKRSTDLLDPPSTEKEAGDQSPFKRQKSTPPPPPPPPAPASTGDEDSKMEDDADATPPTPPPPPKDSPGGNGPDSRLLDPDSEVQGLNQSSQIGVESI